MLEDKTELVIGVYGVVFVFKQKTAYDVRISDWSSDVCSSDLKWMVRPEIRSMVDPFVDLCIRTGVTQIKEWGTTPERSEERRVGKECVIRVDLGGRRIIKIKNK